MDTADAGREPAAQQPTDVREYVRLVFIEGIPYDDGSQFDSSSVPTLLEMLADPAEEESWANIVVLLGIIGDESALDPLTAFVDHDTEDGKLSLAHYRAKTSAIMSLGYLLHKSGSQRALGYLAERMYPEGWEKLPMEAVGPYHTDKPSRDQDFAKYAILGLALSGDPGAKTALDEFQARRTDFQAAMNDIVVEVRSWLVLRSVTKETSNLRKSPGRWGMAATRLCWKRLPRRRSSRAR